VKYIGGGPVSRGLMVLEIRTCKIRQEKISKKMRHDTLTWKDRLLVHFRLTSFPTQHRASCHNVDRSIVGVRRGGSGRFVYRVALFIGAIRCSLSSFMSDHAVPWLAKRAGSGRADTATTTTINQHTLNQSIIRVVSRYPACIVSELVGTHHVFLLLEWFSNKIFCTI